MNRLALSLYRHLPAPARSAAATYRGWVLRSWRYGQETDRLVAEAEEREAWTPARWAAWRENRLAYVLHRAATTVPYYRDAWAARRRHGDRRSWERLEHWPILDKAAIRREPRQFVADDRRIGRMFHERTSGTTGTQLDLWLTRDTVRRWYALFELRGRVWHGVSRRDPWAMLGGQLVVPVSERRPPFWVWNAALRQLYCSSYHLSPDLIPAYLDVLTRYQITYLLGYPSALAELAACALTAERRDVHLRVVISNAEPLFDDQRETIQQAFHCAVRNTYGMAEMVAAASECESGSLHEWPDVGWTELLDDDGRPVEDGRSGEVVATGLLNADMPLIRYRMGDRLTRSRGLGACACGRTLPVIESVEGRADDTLYTRDGRRIGRLDSVFKQGVPIREAQIVQETFDRIRVRYVPLPGFDVAAGRRLESAIHARLGDIEIVLEPLPSIPRGANGKFRAVVCAIPDVQDGRVAACSP